MAGIISGLIAEQVAAKEQKQSALDRHKAAFSSDPNTLGFTSNLLFGAHKNDKVKEIKLEDLEVSPQVRKTFIADEISELAASIKEHGLLQPITVYPIEGNRYHLVCGEKRYRACKQANLATITAYLISPPKNKVELIALQIIENLHRSNPPTFEIAEAISQMQENGLKITDIVDMISCSREYVYQLLRFHKLTEEEKSLFANWPKQFLLNYCRIKDKSPSLAEKLFDAAKKQPKERVTLMAKTVWEKLQQQQQQNEGENQDNDVTPSKEKFPRIKLNISFSELDKISPTASGDFKAYLSAHPQETPQALAAKALVHYLNFLQEGGEIFAQNRDSDNSGNGEEA